MIERLVLLKLKPEHATAAVRARIAEVTQRLLPTVPGVTGVAVTEAADDATAQSWDLCLHVRFAAIEDVAIYLPHPVHRAYVDEHLVPVVAAKSALNFR
mgnify:CR=1 FL=1